MREWALDAEVYRPIHVLYFHNKSQEEIDEPLPPVTPPHQKNYSIIKKTKNKKIEGQ